MNLLKHRIAPLLVALCATGVQADGLGTAKVAMADLDLGTADGMANAQSRVEQTARRLCRQLGDMNDLSRHENYLACVNSAVTAALQQLRRPALAALAGERPAKAP
jgi:UrcA family protein